MSPFIANIDLMTRHNAFIAYGLIYGVTVFLGNISAFVNFWFAFQANADFWRVAVLFLVILLAEATGDCMWYAFGRYLRTTRFGTWIKERFPGHGKAEAGIQKKGKRYLFLSKFAYGSAAPVAFSLGWLKMDFRAFAKNSVVSIAVTLPLVIALVYGLFSGLSPLRALAAFKHIELIFLIAFASFIILNYLVVTGIRAIIERYGYDADHGDQKS